jgi:hypothetical protein
MRVPNEQAVRQLADRLFCVAKRALNGKVDDLAQARAIRLKADHHAPMSGLLARVHRLCKQMSAIKGAAAR